MAIFIILLLGVYPVIAGPLFENEKQLRALVSEGEVDVSAFTKSVAEPHRNADRLRAAALEAFVRRVHLTCMVLSYRQFLYNVGSLETRAELEPMWRRATREVNGLEDLLRQIHEMDEVGLAEIIGDLHLKNKNRERMIKELLKPPHSNTSGRLDHQRTNNSVVENGEQLTRKVIALLILKCTAWGGTEDNGRSKGGEGAKGGNP